MKKTSEIIARVINELFGSDTSVELTRPEPQFGDFATNIALKLAKDIGKSPREIAEKISEKMQGNNDFKKIEVAGPGFINISLTDQALVELTQYKPVASNQALSYVIEYSCPNAFKELHTGHLYQTILGDVMARLIESTGASVHRTSFGGDIGLHVAKCLYGMVQNLGGELPQKLDDISKAPMERAYWISQCYVAGSQAYENEFAAKNQIELYNQTVYKIHDSNEHGTPIAEIYWTTRQWSFDYFEAFYSILHVDNMRYIPESSTAELGLSLVKDGLEKGIFKESDGAVVFEGDLQKKLHTRVFITSKGLPTYETKDIGVIFTEKQDYNFDKRLLITGNEQSEYMKVVFAAADALSPGLESAMHHVTNGTVRFGDGKKMSSRLGNVSRAIDVVNFVKDRIRDIGSQADIIDDVALGAIKFEFLRHRVGNDIAFDIEESVSIHGSSGPYLQYAHARACSILEKSKYSENPEFIMSGSLEESERSLVRKLGEYNEALDKSVNELMPHHICTYLYELAQEFNRFYEKSRIIDSDREILRIQIVIMYRDTLARGLNMLGIVAPEKM
ncbi:arginine--tRNA ligase [Candidatus Saccharibacteria bacterium]|nr:arginine--tRNA ligase [Candidatus Saccharibacteria bacterium]NCU40721.1 arginine--tRNA ligase [Candidatus Saccharibacteria bacterium]